jgi:hypothetical protein
LVILAVFWSSIPIVLAADDSIYSASGFAQSINTDPPGFNDGSVAAPQVLEKSALEPAHSESAGQPAESINDRFIAMGIVAGLLVFAFFRKKAPPQ